MLSLLPMHCTALTAVKLLCIKVVRLFIAILHAVQTSALHVRWGLSSNKNISLTRAIWHNFTVFIIIRFLKIFGQCTSFFSVITKYSRFVNQLDLKRSGKKLNKTKGKKRKKRKDWNSRQNQVSKAKIGEKTNTLLSAH